MDINERAESLVNAMLRGQNDFILASNKQQQELSEVKNSNMQELMEIYDKGYNDAVEKAWNFITKHFDATVLDTNGSIGYGKEGVNFEQFKQAMEVLI